MALLYSDQLSLRAPYIDKVFNRLSSILASRTTLNVDGVDFALLDGNSLFVVLPEFESWMWNYLKVKKRDVFLDVGAHIGKYTCQIAKKVNVVIAVEPNPNTHAVLLRNLRKNKIENVVVFNVAAWNENCKATFFVHHRAAINSLKDEHSKVISIEAKKLDDILKPLAVKLDWVKIDVEGAEIEVLQGLKHTLKKDHPKLIVETRESNVDVLKTFMERLGYKATPIRLDTSPIFDIRYRNSIVNIWHFYCTKIFI